MRRATGEGMNGGCEALLLDGPLAGTRVRVTMLADGDPIGFLLIHGEHRGAYVLAGCNGVGGLLQYYWVAREEWSEFHGWLRFCKDTL